LADSLAISTSLFKIPLPPKIKYEVTIRYRPSIPDNIRHWKVFEDDLEIKKFLQSVDEFSALHIDQDPDLKSHPHPKVFLNEIANHHIIHLPSNHIPKGLVPLEILFNGNDVALKGRVSNEDVGTNV
jgi:hypothetical protein